MMLPYAIGLLLSLTVYWFISNGKSSYDLHYKRKRGRCNKVSMACFMAAIPLIIISGIRYDVGTDYFATYYTGFYRILNGNTLDGFEPSYFLLNKLIQIFTHNAFVLFFITSLVYIGIVFWIIKNESINVPLSILLFIISRYYFIGQNAVRQFIAIAILTMSIKYVIERKSLKYILCIVLAASFHYTSLVFAPVYFIGRLKLPKTRLILWVIIDVLVFTIGTGLITKALQGTKYAMLIVRFGVAGLQFTILTIFINTILVYIAYGNYENRKNDDRYIVYLNIQIFAFLISLVIRSIPLMERLYWIFSFPMIVTFPYLYNGFRSRNKMIIKYTFLIILATYMMYDIAILRDHDAIPYQTIIGKNASPNLGWARFLR